MCVCVCVWCKWNQGLRGRGRKQLYASVAVTPAPTGILPDGHLYRVSRQSRLSIEDKGDNVVKSGAVYGFPGICFTTVENPRKPQLGNRLMKTLTIHRLKWGPLPPNEVCRYIF